MSETLQAPDAAALDAPLTALVLHPVHGGDRDAYTVSLEPELLSLIAPDGRLVMMLPREEAVRHVRFNYDVLRGRTVSFVVVEGLKAHTFKCPLLEREQLLAWLPQKPRQEQEREVQHYGVALTLLGAGLLLFQAFFFWVWGLALVLVGALDVVLPRRFMYGVNAAVLFTIAVVLFFAPRPVGLSPGENLETVRLLSTGLGSLLILWSVQQVAMMGPVRRLRMARQHADQASPTPSAPSSTVKRVAAGLAALGGVFGAHLVWVALLYWRGQDELAPHAYDPLFYGIGTFTTLGAASVLWARGFQAYFEAKVAAQFALVLVVFHAAGLVDTLLVEQAPALAPYALREGLLAFANVWVWAPLVALVLLFNRWYLAAVERELESNRA